MIQRYGIGIVLLAIIGIIAGSLLFANCYSEHRDLGMSFWTTMTACSG